jgi:HPt (histidine-containing phosphotransfer) domain-containing protein
MRRVALASALVLGLSIGCRSKQTANAGTTDAPDTTETTPAPAPAPEPAASTSPRDFSFDQRQQFTESIRQQLASADQQISDLAKQTKSKGGAVSDRALATIRMARKTVDRNLKRVNSATTANWEQVKRTVSQSVDRLDESIEAAQPK